MRFITDLKEPIRSQVDVGNVMSFPKAVNLASKYESQLNRTPRNSFSKRPTNDLYLDKPPYSHSAQHDQPISSHNGPPDPLAATKNLGQQPMVDTRPNPHAKTGILKCFKCDKSSECP